MNRKTVEVIRQAVKESELDLTGLTVLTECGTGAYMATPFIALLGGVEKVFAVVKPYGGLRTDDIVTYATGIAWDLGYCDKLRMIFQATDAIHEADIVTNSGFVRPLNRELISKMKKGAVIPLMYESWEHREQDVDLNACREFGIPIMGTDETTILPYIGHLALKLIYETGREVYQQRILVVGNRRLCYPMRYLLHQAGAVIVERLDDAEVIVLADCLWKNELIADNGVLSLQKVRDSGATVIHISGRLDKQSLLRAGVTVHPEKIVQGDRMCVALDYLGKVPVIKLTALGLKVGEAMARSMQKYHDARQAIAYALTESPATGGLF